jgi:hypothetical protein
MSSELLYVYDMLQMLSFFCNNKYYITENVDGVLVCGLAKDYFLVVLLIIQKVVVL